MDIAKQQSVVMTMKEASSKLGEPPYGLTGSQEAGRNARRLTLLACRQREDLWKLDHAAGADSGLGDGGSQRGEDFNYGDRSAVV